MWFNTNTSDCLEVVMGTWPTTKVYKGHRATRRIYPPHVREIT